MLKLRLQRRGKKNYATYRVVVAEQHAPVKGRFLADVGSYNPHTDAFNVDKDTVVRWLKQGAQPSATVHNLLVNHQIIQAEKVTIWRAPKKADASAPASPAGEAAKAEASSDEKPPATEQPPAPEPTAPTPDAKPTA